MHWVIQYNIQYWRDKNTGDNGAVLFMFSRNQMTCKVSGVGFSCRLPELCVLRMQKRGPRHSLEIMWGLSRSDRSSVSSEPTEEAPQRGRKVRIIFLCWQNAERGKERGGRWVSVFRGPRKGRAWCEILLVF